MGVVAAGVHHADGPAPEFADCGRAKRHVGPLGHGQRVHVGAQQDGRARKPAAQNRDDTGVGHAGPHFQAEATQMLGHLGGGAEFAVCELRMAVEIAAPLDHARFERGRSGIQFGGCDFGACGTGRDDEQRDHAEHGGRQAHVQVLDRGQMPAAV
jgi:hypothetical protein